MLIFLRQIGKWFHVVRFVRIVFSERIRTCDYMKSMAIFWLNIMKIVHRDLRCLMHKTWIVNGFFDLGYWTFFPIGFVMNIFKTTTHILYSKKICHNPTMMICHLQVQVHIDILFRKVLVVWCAWKYIFHKEHQTNLLFGRVSSAAFIAVLSEHWISRQQNKWSENNLTIMMCERWSIFQKSPKHKCRGIATKKRPKFKIKARNNMRWRTCCLAQWLFSIRYMCSHYFSQQYRIAI